MSIGLYGDPAVAGFFLDEIAPVLASGKRFGERVDAIAAFGLRQNRCRQADRRARLMRLDELADDPAVLGADKSVIPAIHPDQPEVGGVPERLILAPMLAIDSSRAPPRG